MPKEKNATTTNRCCSRSIRIMVSRDANPKNDNINARCTVTEEQEEMMHRYNNATWRMYERITTHRCGRDGFQRECDQSYYNDVMETEGSECITNRTTRHYIDERRNKETNHRIRASQLDGSSIVFKEYPFIKDINECDDTHSYCNTILDTIRHSDQDTYANESLCLHMIALAPVEDSIKPMIRSKTMTSFLMNTATERSSKRNDNCSVTTCSPSSSSPSTSHRHYQQRSKQKQGNNQDLVHDVSPKSVILKEPSQQCYHHDGNPKTHWTGSSSHKQRIVMMMERIPSLAVPEIMIQGLPPKSNHRKQDNWYPYHPDLYSTEGTGGGGVWQEDDVMMRAKDKQDFGSNDLDSSVFELDL
jgi:hypothetical protein